MHWAADGQTNGQSHADDGQPISGGVHSSSRTGNEDGEAAAVEAEGGYGLTGWEEWPN